MDIMRILKKNKKEIDEAIEVLIPRKYDREEMEKTFGSAKYEFDEFIATEAISKPVWDLLDRGGKRWRPVLFMLILEAFGKDSRKFIELAAAVEVVHSGTLMIDDIEDDSDLRRGKPCTHKKFGMDIAINTGNTMYFLPMYSIRRLKLDEKRKNKLYDTYIEEMAKISLGQATDIAWHKGMGDVSESKYMQMCAFKTGTLARMAAKFAAIVVGLDDEKIEMLGSCAETIGVAFQIQDDILNITGSENWGKKHADDITEGKRSLMVIRTVDVADDKDRKRLIEILDMHTRDKKLIDEAIAILKKYDSIDYAKNVGKKIVSEAWKIVEPIFPDNETKKKLMSFINFMIERDI